jgi:uncharacterized membrane protein YGL010W
MTGASVMQETSVLRKSGKVSWMPANRWIRKTYGFGIPVLIMVETMVVAICVTMFSGAVTVTVTVVLEVATGAFVFVVVLVVVFGAADAAAPFAVVFFAATPTVIFWPGC